MTPEERRELWRGLFIMWGLNLAHLAAGLLLLKFSSGAGLIVGYPAIALVYGSMVLLILRDSRLKLRGAIIALSVTFLLSCSCWYYVLNNMKF